MATAPPKLRVVRATTSRAHAAPERSALELLVKDDGGSGGEYRCACGQGLQVFGLGRHQVYFEPGSAGLQDPVIAHACPRCGRGLPRSNPA
jgi:hypothetical protein